MKLGLLFMISNIYYISQMLYSFCVIPEMIGLECKSSQTSNSIRSGQTYLALSAPFDSRELISNSWPYLAATWRGVFPYISTQSISPPVYGGKRKLDVYRQKWSSWGHPPIFKKKRILWDTLNVFWSITSPFWIRIWDPVKRPCMAAICRGLFPSLFW